MKVHRGLLVCCHARRHSGHNFELQESFLWCIWVTLPKKIWFTTFLNKVWSCLNYLNVQVNRIFWNQNYLALWRWGKFPESWKKPQFCTTAVSVCDLYITVHDRVYFVVKISLFWAALLYWCWDKVWWRSNGRNPGFSQATRMCFCGK